MGTSMNHQVQSSGRAAPISEAAWGCFYISLVFGLLSLGIVCSGGNGLLATVFGVAWLAFLCTFGIMADSRSTSTAKPGDGSGAAAAVLAAGMSGPSSGDCGSGSCH